MLRSYVLRDLVRNPRRTLASFAGVVLGVGLFSSVLFFIDGSGASMTKRALAPLALDMQRVLTAPLGGGLEFRERLSTSGRLERAETVRVILTVDNRSTVPANEVVVRDLPPEPLVYEPGTTTLNGRPLRDPGGTSPLAQGLAKTGLNIGTLEPGASARIVYRARAEAPVASAGALPLGGTVSTRESIVPALANQPSHLTLEQLTRAIGKVPGVAAADGLSFVDLPPGSLEAGGRTVEDTIRVFGLAARYRRHYPSVRLSRGSFRAGAALLSVEASRALAIRTGGTVDLHLPGLERPLSLPVSGLTDLSRAKPLFYSRESAQLEAFLYVPNSVVVDPATFRQTIIPAYRAATSRRGHAIKSLPLLEVDVLVRRSPLDADPATALAQSQGIARAINRIAPRQDYLIDNISNTLQVARDDARVAKRMFLFLGLPGALLAAFLTAFAGGVLAATQRREQANLRLRGAHRGHLLRMLAYRTLVLAGVGSVVGAALGFVCILVVLGPGILFETSTSALVVSGIASIGIGTLVTGLALYLSGRRSLKREIAQERGELGIQPEPAWRRLGLDVGLVAAAAVAEVIAFRAGVFDAPHGSVYFGRAVSLPSHLVLAPLGVWIGGMMLAVRLSQAVASRLAVPPPPRFGPLVRGALTRTLRRRSRALGGGVLAIGLVVAFGTSLAFFAATYRAAKEADARFAVGSDLRVTPSVGSTRPHPPGFASKLLVPGVEAATPVVFKPLNALLTSDFNQDRANLAAIDPDSFPRVSDVPDSFFVDMSAREAISAIQADPDAVLLEATIADELKIEEGDTVDVLLARGTPRQTRVQPRAVGFFERFPGFPEGVHIVGNIASYQAAIGVERVDFFIVRTADHGRAALTRAEAALRSGPGRGDPLQIDTTETTFDKDQSSLTALNVRGLLSVDSFYTLLMAAAGIGIFVFGLMLHRRREYVTLRAQGMQTRELRALVLGESAFVALWGLLTGVAIGVGMAYLLVHVLRPLFVLRPVVVFPATDMAVLIGLAVAATLTSALVATGMLSRLRPTELLREQ